MGDRTPNPLSNVERGLGVRWAVGGGRRCDAAGTGIPAAQRLVFSRSPGGDQWD